MSQMMDYLVNGGDEVALLKAQLEHMGGALEREIELRQEAAVKIERLRAREDKLLRATIDATWGEALEDGSVPATKKQDWIIAYARSRISAARTPPSALPRNARRSSVTSSAAIVSHRQRTIWISAEL